MHGWLILALCAGWLAHASFRDRLRAQTRAHHRRSAHPSRSPRP